MVSVRPDPFSTQSLFCVQFPRARAKPPSATIDRPAGNVAKVVTIRQSSSNRGSYPYSVWPTYFFLPIVPDYVRRVLAKRYEFLVTEKEMVADLTDTFRTCRTCLEWAASQESVKCEYVLPTSGVSRGVFAFEPNAIPSRQQSLQGLVSHGMRLSAVTCKTFEGLQLDVLAVHARPCHPERRQEEA